VTSAWFVYLIECSNGSVYCGIAPDVEKRYAAHLAGKGARYTRSWRPVRLLGAVRCTDRAEASREEARIKRLTPAEKRAFASRLQFQEHPQR
jgi:putative endonuclease